MLSGVTVQYHVDGVDVLGRLVGAALGGAGLAEQEPEAVSGAHGVKVLADVLGAYLVGDPAVLQCQHGAYLDGILPRLAVVIALKIAALVIEGDQMGGQILKIVPRGLQQLRQTEGGEVSRLLIPRIKVHGLHVADVDVGVGQQIVDVKAHGGVHHYTVFPVVAIAQEGVGLTAQGEVALQL